MLSGIEIEPKLFHAAIAGIGDEAFDSPDGKLQHALYVRKGQAAFAVIANVTLPLVATSRLSRWIN